MRSLIPFVTAVIAAALVGTRFLPGAWYETLAKPSWTPPNWLFGPVWACLYVCIALAGWLVYRNSATLTSPVLLLWATQLLLNGLWSWLFFGLHSMGLAFLDISLLLALIVAFIALGFRVSRVGAILFTPYAIWVAYALALNFAIWRANTPALVLPNP